MITIEKWELYQSQDEEITNNITIKQQSNNNQITTNKNDKNDKNEKNIYSDFEKIILNKYPGKKVKATRDKKVSKLIDKYSIDELTRCIERYAKECIGKEKQFILNESTFWNGRYIDYLDSNYEESKAKPKAEFIDERSAKRIEARKKRLEESGEPIGYNGG